MFGCATVCRLAAMVVLAAWWSGPAAAQIISVEPRSLPFPVLVGAEFTIDPSADQSHPLFRVSEGTLWLRATPAGFVDMAPYCRVPERHWGPVSVAGCELEVEGRFVQTGLALPSRVSLADVPPGSTITFRMLVQAPLIVLDLQGNPTVVLDTFLEEYRWKVYDIWGP